MNAYLWLIPASPLLGTLSLTLFGARLRTAGIAVLACCAAAGAVLAVVAAWLAGAAATEFHQTVYIWMAVDGWRPTIGLTLDRLALVMVSVISGIGLLIHIYSASFMRADPGLRRYFCFLNLFLAGMLLLVLADNLLLLYLGWELVGLCSFALIGFWFQDPLRASAGRKAFIVTRVGDTALAIGIFLLFSEFQTLQFTALFAAAQASWTAGEAAAVLAAILLLGGALGKSAQLPLQVWLPDAMAGPAPVSALIHAATMVTAGVYLIARLHPLFELAPAVLWSVALIGALTIVYGASCALAQHDIKRVLAYSTISQIGYMFVALGSGAYALALFHLMTHACFKALLFLGAGAVIRASGGEHDIFRMGGLARRLPLVHGCFLAGALSLAALPAVSAGFYSKDAILTAAWAAPGGGLLWTLGVTGALLTALYIFRTYLLVFQGAAQGTVTDTTMPWPMAMPLLVLALLSVVAGFVEMPQGWPGSRLWGDWLGAELGHAPMPATVTAYGLQFASAAAVLCGIGLAFSLVRRERDGGRLPLADWLLQGWRFDALYAALIVQPYRQLAQRLQQWLEGRLVEGGVEMLRRGFVNTASFSRGRIEGSVIEGAVHGIQRTLRRCYGFSTVLHNGLLSRYAAAVAVGGIALLGYWLGESYW